MPSNANPINPPINADMICLFGHFDCMSLSVLPNFGNIIPILFPKYYILSSHNIPPDVYINTCME